MSLEVIERLDRLFVRTHNHREAGLVIRRGEIDLFLTLIIDRHAADDDVDILCLKSGNESVKADILYLRLASHLLCNGTDEIHVKALIFLLSLILELERSEVDGRTDAKYLGLLLRLIARAAAAADHSKAQKSTGKDHC